MLRLPDILPRKPPKSPKKSIRIDKSPDDHGSKTVSKNRPPEQTEEELLEEERKWQEKRRRLSMVAGNVMEDGGNDNDKQEKDKAHQLSVPGGLPKIAPKPKAISIWDRLRAGKKQPAADGAEPEKGEKFKALAKIVKTNLMWGRMEKTDKEGAEAFVVKTRQKETLVFDKSIFKAREQTYGGLSTRTRLILAKHPVNRTNEDIFYLRDVVDRLTSFHKYSRKVKNELARVIHYEAWDNGRVVVQQGHIGMSFYFIVTGRVIIKMVEEDKETGRQVTHILGELTAGSSFGELALMHNIKRSATIICNGFSEFLRVDKDDFEEVLMNCYQREWKEKLTAFSNNYHFKHWKRTDKENASRLSKLKEYGSHELIYGNQCKKEPDYIYFLIHGEVRIVRSIILGVRREAYGVKRYDLLSRLETRGVGVRAEQVTQYGQRKALAQAKQIYIRETHFWSVGVMGPGFYCSVGENFTDIYIVSKSRCEFLLVPRSQFVKMGLHRMIDKMAEDLDDAIPSEEELFRNYFQEARWSRYKQDIVCEVVKRRRIPRNTTTDDVPDAIRMESWRIGMSEEYKNLNTRSRKKYHHK